MYDFWYSLWLFLPAGIANMIPTIVWRLPMLKNWNTPVDAGKTFRGIRMLGANKTWRGVVCGVIAGAVVFILQQELVSQIGAFGDYLVRVGYTELPIIYGVLLGFGALFGDIIESFIKRQKQIPAGTSWFPFDQLDYIIGACIVTLPLYLLEPVVYVFIFVNWFALHLIFSALGYVLKFKKALI